MAWHLASTRRMYIFKWTIKWGLMLSRKIFPKDGILETPQRRNLGGGAEKLPSRHSLKTTLLDFYVCGCLVLPFNMLVEADIYPHLVSLSKKFHFSFLITSWFVSREVTPSMMWEISCNVKFWCLLLTEKPKMASSLVSLSLYGQEEGTWCKSCNERHSLVVAVTVVRLWPMILGLKHA